MQALRERSTKSFEEFVAQRSVALQRFAYLVVFDYEDAKDAVQDALVGLYRHWDRVSSTGDPEAYVRRSIVNAHVTQWRKHGKERLTADLAVLDGPAPGDLAESVADADAVARLFAKLDARSRGVLLMRIWEGRSFADIASACDCAEATARSIVHRAVTNLRTAFIQGNNHD